LLTPGMTRQDVSTTLEQVGSVSVQSGQISTLDDKISTDRIIIRICLLPINNLVLKAEYTRDGKLLNILTEDSIK
jgi:hypothetical protein